MSAMDGLDSLLGEYALDARERLDRVEQSLLALDAAVGGEREAELGRLKAELHTLKGNAAMMGFAELQQLAHAMEDSVLAGVETLDVAALLVNVDDFRRGVTARTASGPATDGDAATADVPGGGAAAAAMSEPTALAQGAVRVPFAALDPLVDLLAEMVVERTRLEDLLAQAQAAVRDLQGDTRAARARVAEVQLALATLVRTLDALQLRVMALRMTPLRSLFGSLQRIVHDEARAAGRQAVLVTDGGETPLDKALLELANDALGHLVRNAVVHGLESPAERVAAGKPPRGTVHVTAAVRGGEVLVEVAEDGRGIDVDALRRAAEGRGIALDPDAGPYDILFHDGFSTRASADLSSGRGVGLSAVRHAVRRQGGRIEVLSEPGRGTAFRLWLPLSVTITRALLVRADDELYALPLALVVESRRLRPGEGHEVNHAGVIRWRDETIALLDLGAQFGTAAGRRDKGYVIVVESAGRRRGLIADAIIGLQEVVVRSLDPVCGHPAGVAGSTVLGDGRAILILDARTLVDLKTNGRAA